MPVADLPLPIRTRGLQSHPCASEERPPSRFGVRGRSPIREPAFTLSNIYAQPLCVVVPPSSPKWVETSRHPVRGRSMQDPVYEFPRIPLPRTWVNKGRDGRLTSLPGGPTGPAKDQS